MRADAFEGLFERNFDAVYGYLARRVGPELGRDLASETFTRAFAGRKRFDPQRGEARPWLFGIANNLLRRHHRDEERRLRALARIDVRHEDDPPAEPRLAEALAGLSREERDVLLLFAWADLAYAEIATTLDLPSGPCGPGCTAPVRTSAPRWNARRRSMDELALLKGFRLDDAAPDSAREHARAALRAAVARHRRSRRRTFVVLAFAGAVILAGAAYAVARELIVGSPAPEEVRVQGARFGHAAELIPVPHPDDPQLEQARVAAVLDSSVGRVYLFASPSASGLCGSVWIEGDRGYKGRLNMTTSCGGIRRTSFGFGSQPFRGKTVRLASGHVAPGVARIAARFGRRTAEIPLTGRWFLAEFRTLPDGFVAYDEGGHVLEERRFPRLPRRMPRVRTPHQVTRAREVAGIRTQEGSEEIRVFVATASNGGYCQIVRSNRRPSNRGCGMPSPKPRELGVWPMNFGGGPPDGILILVGPVGSDVAKLELLYEDGRVATVPIHDGWALYEVARQDYVAGQRPQLLIGRDASGKEIASKRMPWIT